MSASMSLSRPLPPPSSSSSLPRAPSAAATAAARGGAATGAGKESEWARLVRSGLNPRLLRLPLLSLLFLHTIVTASHLLYLAFASESPPSSSWLQTTLSFFKPTLLLCSLSAFSVGILAPLLIQRRLLSRSYLLRLFCDGQDGSRSITLASSTLAADSLPARALYELSLSSTWASAIFHGVVSSLFSICTATSFALYSGRVDWWLPFHQVASTRRTTGSFGRVISTTNSYWRPNEICWCLIVQPFFWGLLASLASSIATKSQLKWPVPPPRTPPFPPSLVDCLAPDVSVKGSLTSRITATLPRKVALAAVSYAASAIAVSIAYLPLRLPLFRLYLAVLPPYSALRRLCIPTLRSGQGLLAPSSLFTLTTTSAVTAAIQGATLSLALNLWEIYATHPMGITANAASTKPIETLISALESYSPANKRPTAATANVSSAEKNYLFTHALFDLTTLSTDTTTQGSEKRRAFFKHFATPTVDNRGLLTSGAGGSSQFLLGGATPGTNGSGTVSAWERVSEVLIAVVKEATKDIKDGPSPSQPAAAASATAAASSSTAMSSTGKSTSPGGKELQVKSGGIVGSTPAAAPPATVASSTATSTSTEAPPTVWQRLVTPKSSSSSSSGSGPAPSDQPQTSSASTPQPASPSASTPAPQASTLSTVISTLLSSIPGAQQKVSQAVDYLNAHSTAATTPRSLRSLKVVSPLSLVLITHSILRLLPLSLQEDEWGSVTLSERKSLGVDDWSAVCRTLLGALGEHGGGGDQDDDGMACALLIEELKGGLERTNVAFASTTS